MVNSSAQVKMVRGRNAKACKRLSSASPTSQPLTLFSIENELCFGPSGACHDSLSCILFNELSIQDTTLSARTE